MQVKPTDLIYAVSLTDSMPSQNEVKAFMKVQLIFIMCKDFKNNLLHNDIYYILGKIGNLCGGSGDKKIRSRGTLLIQINRS